MKILVAVDGSQHSTDMLQKLIAHLGWFAQRPQLALLYVHLELPHGVGAAWVGKAAVQQYYDEETEAALAPARAALGGAGLAFDELRRVGDPATEIVSAAESGGFDLIAMGTHGKGGLTKLVMGSVATKVIAVASLPVLLVK